MLLIAARKSSANFLLAARDNTICSTSVHKIVFLDWVSPKKVSNESPDIETPKVPELCLCMFHTF